MLLASLGLLRTSIASSSSVRSFSSSPVIGLLKSHSGAKKRFRATGSGLWKRAQVGKQHINTGMSASRINRLAKSVICNKTQSKTLRKLLPGRV